MHEKAKLTDKGLDIARIKKELRDVKMEAEILKKAVGTFSPPAARESTAFEVWVHEEAKIHPAAAPKVKTLLR
ncbi:MAG: hypothetical protein ACJASQ_003479 [Crocinitomicaceae bacterium]